MDPRKDYYATLGVLPSAEPIVIRAAYPALAQRYHPDRHSASTGDDLQKRMAELNEAYEVLSNDATRREYDKARGTGAFSADPYFTQSAESEPTDSDPLEHDWAIALRYYPDIANLARRLSRISWRLGYAFRAHLLDAKAFENRAAIADALEKEFLRSYFGENEALLAFARHLIERGHKAAARALNEAVRILGSNVNSERVIGQITADFDLNGEKAAAMRARQQVIVKCCASCRAIVTAHPLYSFIHRLTT